MKLEKGEEIVKPTYSDVYKFELKFMIGDADGWDYRNLYISPDNKHIERFITFLDDCKNAYPHGRGGYDNYNDIVSEWNIFCGDDDLTKGDKELQQFRFEWPYDSYGDCQTSFSIYKITYFDTNTVEYEVNVTK